MDCDVKITSQIMVKTKYRKILVFNIQNKVQSEQQNEIIEKKITSKIGILPKFTYNIILKS